MREAYDFFFVSRFTSSHIHSLGFGPSQRSDARPSPRSRRERRRPPQQSASSIIIRIKPRQQSSALCFRGYVFGQWFSRCMAVACACCDWQMRPGASGGAAATLAKVRIRVVFWVFFFKTVLVQVRFGRKMERVVASLFSNILLKSICIRM